VIALVEGSIQRVAKLIRDGMKMPERHRKAVVELLVVLLLYVSRVLDEVRVRSILTVLCGRRCVGDLCD
jgi:hypothetical protein